MEQLTMTEYQVGASYGVYITHINDPSNFFVRPIKYSNFINTIEKMFPKFKPHSLNTADLIIFNLCWTKRRPKFARGQVLYIANKNDIITCNVLALDYGFAVLDVPLCEIWKCNETYRNMPPLAVKCQLIYCLPKGGATEFDEEAIEAFKLYVSDEKARIIIQSKASYKLTVEMYNSCPDDISTLLALTNYTKMGYVPPSVSLINYNLNNNMVYSFRQYKVGQTIHVKVLSGDIYRAFYVGEVNDFQTYRHELENFGHFASRGASVKPRPYELQPGTPVFVKEKEKVYNRAIVKEVAMPYVIVPVHLVDLGRSCLAPVYHMRHMVRECIDMPPISIFCRANEKQAHFNSGYAQFVQPGYEFLITFEKLGNEYNIPHTVFISPVQRKIEYVRPGRFRY